MTAISALLSFLSLTTVSIGSFWYQYPVALAISIYQILKSLRAPIHVPLLKWFAVVIFCWFFGVFSGLAQGNDIKNVFLNYPGLLLLSVFILVLSCSKLQFDTIFRAFCICGYLYLIPISYFLIRDGVTIGNPVVNGSSAIRIYYSIGLFLYVPILTVYLLSLVSSRLNDIRLGLTPIGLIGLVLLICSGSKGFWLALVFVSFIILGSCLLRAMMRLRLSHGFVWICCIGIVAGIATHELVWSYATFLLDFELDATHPRSVQAIELRDSFSVFGIGFGGLLDSGYSRDLDGYAFELSYHALVSKLGIVFGPLLIVGLFWPFALSTVRTFLYLDKKSAFSLGCSTMLIPSWGNPMLFAPLLTFILALSGYFMADCDE